MTITVTKTHEEKIEVPLVIPSFWKENTILLPGYIAVLDESTCVRIFSSDSSTGHRETITNAHPNSMRKDIHEAYSDWESVSEGEFMEVFSKAYSSMGRIMMWNVTPENYGMLKDESPIDTGSEEAYMELAKQDQL